MQLATSIDDALDRIDENRLVRAISARLPVSPQLQNALHQSDAELVDIGLPDALLAVTTDCVSEEIRAGLYVDPYEIGWVAVVASLSDLAAVGARPTGLMVSLTLDPSWRDTERDALVSGMADALRAHQVGRLGGDTNFGAPSVTTTALGLVDRTKVMTRIGCRPGDTVYLSGPCGAGAAYAFARLFGQGGASAPFRPMAALAAATVIAPLASACIDTSDGLLAALDQLCRLNEVAVEIDDPRAVLHPVAAEIVGARGMSPLLALATLHGEFELCFSVPAPDEARLLAIGRRAGLRLLRVGRVAAPTGRGGGGRERLIACEGVPLDTAAMRNLWSAAATPHDYLRQLQELV